MTRSRFISRIGELGMLEVLSVRCDCLCDVTGSWWKDAFKDEIDVN